MVSRSYGAHQADLLGLFCRKRCSYCTVHSTTVHTLRLDFGILVNMVVYSVASVLGRSRLLYLTLCSIEQKRGQFFVQVPAVTPPLCTTLLSRYAAGVLGRPIVWLCRVNNRHSLDAFGMRRAQRFLIKLV